MLLSTAALGFAVFSYTQEPAAAPTRSSTDAKRVAELETKVQELAYEVSTLKAERAAGDGASAVRSTKPPQLDENGEPMPAAEGDPELAAMVDDAVDRKTKQVMDEMRIKQNKKPEMTVFAQMLELSKEQVAAAERTVVEGQRDVHQILETPTADGRNLMDELVELMAKGIAEPGKDHGWGQWIGSVMSQKVPGTDESYGVRIEAVKTRMRQTFQREWTKEQYAEYQAWGVDPTEIQNVPESPNQILWERIQDRARAMGARIPNSD